MVVGDPLQMRNIDLPSNLKLDQTDINLSTKLKNRYVVFYENLTLKYQVLVFEYLMFYFALFSFKIFNFGERIWRFIYLYILYLRPQSYFITCIMEMLCIWNRVLTYNILFLNSEIFSLFITKVSSGIWYLLLWYAHSFILNSIFS